MENNEIVVKQKNNKGLIILVIILILIVLGLSVYFVYDKFMAKEENNINEISTNVKNDTTVDNSENDVSKQTDIDYSGYYKGCNKMDGDEYCVELVLNENKTAFILSNPVSSVGNSGNYEIDDNNIVINSNYCIASVNPGLRNETFNLSIENNQITYTFINTKFILSKTTEDKLTIYNQMKSLY